MMMMMKVKVRVLVNYLGDDESESGKPNDVSMYYYKSDKQDDDEKYSFYFCFSESGVRLDLQEKQDFPKFYCFLPQNRLLLFYTR